MPVILTTWKVEIEVVLAKSLQNPITAIKDECGEMSL
jgi:hypothetical protein